MRPTPFALTRFHSVLSPAVPLLAVAGRMACQRVHRWSRNVRAVRRRKIHAVHVPAISGRHGPPSKAWRLAPSFELPRVRGDAAGIRKLYIYTVRSVLGGLNYRHESFRTAGSSSEPRPYETEHGAVTDAGHRRDLRSRPCTRRWLVRLANHWGYGIRRLNGSRRRVQGAMGAARRGCSRPRGS